MVTKMPSKKRIKAVITALIEKWNKQGYSPRSINCGCCMEFSQELCDIFTKARQHCGEEWPSDFKTDVDPYGHCYTKIGSLFYDAEAPDGVTSADLLPFFQRAAVHRAWDVTYLGVPA